MSPANPSRTFSVTPFLIDGAQGPLACMYYPPAAGVEPREDVLLVPAFAEEMNRCRAMVSLQARALSSAGLGTLIVDMYGTGDSAGEFSAGSWESWRDDMQRGISWLREHGQGCHALWGVRLGAIMAAQIAAQDPLIRHLLLWQPVVQGKNYWTQFLRIRIAAEMELKDGLRSTEELRKRAAEGGIVEVSGYAVGGALATALDTVRMPDAGQLAGKEISWFEVLSGEDSNVSRANTKCIEDYRAGGLSITTKEVSGPPFWHVHERELAPELIEATTLQVRQWEAPDGQRARKTSIANAAIDSDEVPVVFAAGDAELSGVIHRGSPSADRGIIIVVAGGPQYRVGAHRQFVSLARQLAAKGFPVMRFDLKGMGDSSGSYVGYQQSRADIRAAIDKLVGEHPHIREVILFGECESASGILFYAYQDERVSRIALVNPWVRTQEGQAEVILKHYYLDRLMSRKFWKSVLEGRVNPVRSLSSFFDVFATYLRGRKTMRTAPSATSTEDFDRLPLPVKTAEGLRRFAGKVLILMSGRDYIAREFDEVTKSSKAWEGLLAGPRITRKDIADADHTFSKPAWKAEAQETLLNWIGSN